MGLVYITSWYPEFNGSHFGLPPSSIHQMTGPGWQNGVNDDIFAQAPLYSWPMRMHLLFSIHSKAIKLYMQDLCFNPQRFDSWAGLALARQKRLDDKINLVSVVVVVVVVVVVIVVVIVIVIVVIAVVVVGFVFV